QLFNQQSAAWTQFFNRATHGLIFFDLVDQCLRNILGNRVFNFSFVTGYETLVFFPLVEAFVTCDLNQPTGQSLGVSQVCQLAEQVETNGLKNVSSLFLCEPVSDWDRINQVFIL